MHVLSTTSVPADARSYVTSIADTEEQIHAAQRLRYQVFGQEKGARLHTVGDRDVDEFDEVMDHLIVTDTSTDTVVGTYRLLPPGRSERLYSETEFDLRGLPDEIRLSMVEAGGPVSTPTTARAR
ncbi:GNAT family N-acetyltransferase [Streptomyces sp. FXJ1.4098]|nr:GNAT family N-acetyltransferase [Streptomyces sp. FXJ1.4098]